VRLERALLDLTTETTMRRVLITGSSSGLGFLAGKLLVEQGHRVVLHARDDAKARATKAALPGCDAVVVGDVSSMAGMTSVAEQANALDRFDAVIHNVALGSEERRVPTSDGMTELFSVNVVAPYVLTALIERPERLIYLSSDMHAGGNERLEDPQWETRPWSGGRAYSDTKLYDLMLALYLARRWPDTLVNAVDPGWVPTRMGGSNAPGDALDGATTQAWLAVSDEPSARVTGHYFHHQKPQRFKKAASQPAAQERLVEYLELLTGIKLPRATLTPRSGGR
jgi:NAD(P)-dependent dehydrogenase (short-subunit alcohol dehydrogenase family)